MILENQIHLADCFDLLPSIPAGSVDLVLTDPPYEKSLRDIHSDWNNGLDWDRLSEQFDRVLKPSGQVALFCDWITGQTITTALMDRFKFRFIWIWRKPGGQPVGFKEPIRDCELILVYSKKKAKTRDLVFNWKDISTFSGEPYRREFDRKNATRKPIKPYVSESNGIRYPRQILNFPSKCNLPESERTDHPTQKPLGLCGYIIKALSNPGDLVCDPFTGSGSIPIACHRLGRRFIAFERDPKYYAESVDRLKNERAQGNLFANNKTSRARLNDPGQIKVTVPVLAENRLNRL